ncbi:hypothetical protein [Aquamicrobium zhengzhouense]|uniref:Uncharacterized protein n=1 Tax=Aquamicrobium zhengzhouense TaxID=2781738 RepID=A0ABS0SAB4_9HYPH|nr:hypothetical protein [Aquamicrobium zhengzhouense]MBI1620197.1 hypothetical protein [Aquamicrobium zhengzhouense]
MAHFHADNLSRLEDVESLLLTAQAIAARLSDEELDEAKRCIRHALEEVRNAKSTLALR